MKKLATVLATALTLAFAAPAFACPHGEKGTQEKTADKAKKDQPAPAKIAAPKKAEPKKQAAPKTADPGKVSRK